MPIDFIGLYDTYLKELQAANKVKRYDGHEEWYHASSAGRCLIYQQLHANPEVTPSGVDERTQRLFRLGDLVHTDIQEATSQWFNKNAKPGDLLLIEKEIRIISLNVRGFLDVGMISGEDCELDDIKTSASFKWTKTFGQKANRDMNPSLNYELQLGTYMIGLLEKYPQIKRFWMNLLWYKKDNSDMRPMPIDNKYVELAREYWEEVLENKDVKLLAPTLDQKGKAVPRTLNCPIATWECNYCDVRHACDIDKPEVINDDNFVLEPPAPVHKRGQF